MKNSGLKNFYNRIYKKGEDGHYTKLILNGGAISMEKKTILAEIPWKGKNVVDIGCGTGELAYLMALAGAKSVLGVDYSTEAINIAKKRYKHPNLSYECKDLFEITDSFDVVTVVGVLEHVDDPRLFFKQTKKILNEKGSLIITCPNWSNPRGYILLALKELFGAKITLGDIYYFTPIEFEKWSKEFGMKLKWKTIEQQWGHGEKMITDFKKRLPKLLTGKRQKEKIDKFIKWMEKHIPLLEEDQKSSGAVGFYHFKN